MNFWFVIQDLQSYTQHADWIGCKVNEQGLQKPKYGPFNIIKNVTKSSTILIESRESRFKNVKLNFIASSIELEDDRELLAVWRRQILCFQPILANELVFPAPRFSAVEVGIAVNLRLLLKDS